MDFLLNPPTYSQVAGGPFPQYEWEYSYQACYRPSVDFKLEWICAAYPSIYPTPEGDLTQESIEQDISASFDVYSACCPDTNYFNRTNVYTLTKQCPYIACFSSNLTLVADFPECVDNQTVIAKERRRKNGTMGANATRTGFGYCDSINFQKLKEGVKGGAQHHALVSIQGVLVLVFAMFWACGGFI